MELDCRSPSFYNLAAAVLDCCCKYSFSKAGHIYIPLYLLPVSDETHTHTHVHRYNSYTNIMYMLVHKAPSDSDVLGDI